MGTGRSQSYLFARFLGLSAKDYFVENHEDFMKVVYQVNFLDVVEVVVKNFHEQVDQLQIT